MGEFTMIANGCSHVSNDIQQGYRSFARAVEDTFRSDFPLWDIWINLGDNCGSQLAPTDKEGREFVGQKFTQGADIPHKIYDLSGNHDREAGTDNDLGWFRKWCDPMGENTTYSGISNSLRPYPLDTVNDSAARYKIEVTGTNIIILMMGDMNRPVTGHHGIGGYGGDPAGVVSQSTFDWWKAQVESYRGTDKVVITCHHYLLKNTTTCTGHYEGGTLSGGVYTPIFHGPGSNNGKYSGYLAFVDEVEDDTQFTDHLLAHPGDTQLWLGAHSHCAPGTKTGGKGLVEYRADLGCSFVNCAALTNYHGQAATLYPRSRLLKFTHNSGSVNVDNYHHTNKGLYVRGFRAGSVIDLGKPFIQY